MSYRGSDDIIQAFGMGRQTLRRKSPRVLSVTRKPARDWEIENHDLVTEERAALQKGMNYGVGKKYSVFLMSVREGAPYADALDEVSGMLTYEGHDEPQRKGGPDPKTWISR